MGMNNYVNKQLHKLYGVFLYLFCIGLFVTAGWALPGMPFFFQMALGVIGHVVSSKAYTYATNANR